MKSYFLILSLPFALTACQEIDGLFSDGSSHPATYNAARGAEVIRYNSAHRNNAAMGQTTDAAAVKGVRQQTEAPSGVVNQSHTAKTKPVVTGESPIVPSTAPAVGQ